MALSQKQLITEQKRAGVLSEDTRFARFYLHDVLDTDKTYADAHAKAIEIAEQKTLRTKIYTEPDYTRDNLIRLGAKNVYKKVLYINIGHRGLKKTENKSRIATEHDKEFWSDEYLKFKGANNEKEKVIPDNKDIQSGWMDIPINSERFEFNSSQETIQNNGNFSYTFSI